MKQPATATTTVGLLVAILCLVAGCIPEVPYEDCAFPSAQEDYCVLKAGDSAEVKLKKSTSNCVIEHPQCLDDYCVSYRGSDGFCSLLCEDDGDCPESGACREFSMGCKEVGEEFVCPKYCIKKSLAK